MESLETRCLLAADLGISDVCWQDSADVGADDMLAPVSSAMISSAQHDYDDHDHDDHDHDEHDDHDHDHDDHDDHDHDHADEVTHAELRRDSYGAYYIDKAADVSAEDVVKFDDGDVGDLLPIRIDDVPALHSNPSASQSIYLDFNGQRVSRTGWNESNGGRTIGAPPFDTDNNPKTFSASEQRAIQLIWSRVAEDYAPFDVDVTTESPPSRDFSQGKQAIRVLISSNIDELTGDKWFENVGGVAYVGSWKFESDTPVWVFSNILQGNEKRISEALSHEVGHALGLDHDGTEEEEYFAGFEAGTVSWAPIMGSGSGKTVTQWSRGEYDEANNPENDLSIIASSANNIGIRADDHSSNFFSPTPLIQQADGQTRENGLIATSTDNDIFVFDMARGKLDLDVRGTRYGSNLDIQLTLYDSKVNILGTFNPHDSLDSGVHADLPAGRYFLRVDGAGHGDPKSDGYSDYGSIGQYTITGTIPAPTSTNGTTQPVIENNSSSPHAPTQIGPFGFGDFLLLSQNYGHAVTTEATRKADIDGDDRIGFTDFLILSQNFGR